MATVAVTDTGHLDFTVGLEALERAGHRAILLNSTDPNIIIDRAGDAEALIISSTDVDATLLDRLPALRVVATTTVGADRIDLPAAHARGILVHTLPSLASEEVAVHALAGLLALLRELPASHAEATTGCWDYGQLPVPPRLSELTLGLVGFGQIARRLAALTEPLVDRVIAYDPYAADPWPDAVDQVDLDQLLRTADIVSLHAPATAATVRLIDHTTLATMKPGSYLINVARGALVVEDDLLAALDRGHLRGAFLDVTDPEPPLVDSPLRRHPRILLSPHAGFRSEATLRDYVMQPVGRVLDVLGSSE